jgi:hypothetical protein
MSWDAVESWTRCTRTGAEAGDCSQTTSSAMVCFVDGAERCGSKASDSARRTADGALVRHKCP